jgi:hypothetical protein
MAMVELGAYLVHESFGLPLNEASNYQSTGA